MADLYSSHRHVTSAPRNPVMPEESGWTGLIAFAGVIMILVGFFHAIAGLVAIFRDQYYLVGRNGLVLHLDFAVWGWAYLAGGVVILLAGGGLLSGRTWARVVAVVLAVLSAVLNMAFFPAYPWWSAIMITLDVLVIWAVTVHGSEMKDVPMP